MQTEIDLFFFLIGITFPVYAHDHYSWPTWLLSVITGKAKIRLQNWDVFLTQICEPVTPSTVLEFYTLIFAFCLLCWNPMLFSRVWYHLPGLTDLSDMGSALGYKCHRKEILCHYSNVHPPCPWQGLAWRLSWSMGGSLALLLLQIVESIFICLWISAVALM